MQKIKVLKLKRKPDKETIILISFSTDAFQSEIISSNCSQRKRAGGTSQTACQNRPLTARTLIKPTSLLSQPASSFLMQSHVNCHSYLPSLSHSSLFSWSDYTLHFQLILQPRERTEKNLIFRLSLKCGLIINEVTSAGCIEKSQRYCSPQFWMITSGAPPSALGVSLRGAPLPGSARSSDGRERLRKKESGTEREKIGWQGLICTVEQLFLAELPVLSALKEILCHIQNSSQAFSFLIECLSVTQNTNSI